MRRKQKISKKYRVKKTTKAYSEYLILEFLFHIFAVEQQKKLFILCITLLFQIYILLVVLLYFTHKQINMNIYEFK